MKADSDPDLNRRRGQRRGLKKVWEGNDWMEQVATLKRVGRLLRRPPGAVSGPAGAAGADGGRAWKPLEWHLHQAQWMRARLLKVEGNSFSSNEREYGTLLQKGC